MAVVSPIAMHPTVTEHDYRFPRRPDPHRSTDRIFARMDSQDGHVALTNGNAAAAAAMTSGQLASASSSKNNILNAALFDGFQKVEASSSDKDNDFEKMQSEDPLAAQIWKFFTKTKQELPNQQRMENLTWRMMALNLRRRQQQQQREQQQQQQKTHNRYYYIFLSSRLMPCHVHLIGLSFLASMSFNRLDMAWPPLWGERSGFALHHIIPALADIFSLFLFPRVADLSPSRLNHKTLPAALPSSCERHPTSMLRAWMP